MSSISNTRRKHSNQNARRREAQSQPTRRSNKSSSSSSWCCSFKSPPKSPEILSHVKVSHRKPTPEILSKTFISYPDSPQSSKSGLSLVGRIDPRRILSPGRVSPIDSDPTGEALQAMSPEADRTSNVGQISDAVPVVQVNEVRPTQRLNLCDMVTRGEREAAGCAGRGGGGGGSGSARGDGVFDVRLNLKGKRGGCLALELNSEVLCENSPVFADLIADCRAESDGSGTNLCRIEVPEVENLGVFRDTIELMFEDDLKKRLLKMGAYRAIDVLQVSASIKFTRGVLSCLKYLEAVPWSEEEEEKLKRVCTKFNFDESTTREILARINFRDSIGPKQNLASQLVWAITNCENKKGTKELKSMVKGLLSQSSVYVRDSLDISKEELYAASKSCLDSLVDVFEEASSSIPHEENKNTSDKPYIECISMQVDNINWLVEILLERQMGEEFVDIWTGQRELLKMHKSASPMIRYELSRISAILLLAMGSRKLHCRSESRLKLMQSWFAPMLQDYGWLQRCRKGLDMRDLEEAMGQVLLTLPLKQQYALFMEWFRCFSKQGTECPNLSKAFQMWWRRTFLRDSETCTIETC